MKWGWVLCLLVLTFKCFSQEKTVAGIVFDTESKERIATVNIHNITTGVAIYNNLKGEFQIAAKPGDRLVFSRLEYLPDTIRIQNNAPLAAYMARQAIQLHEVTVHDTAINPDRVLATTRREYSKIYGSLAYSDLLTSPSSGSAGLSIDALWNAFSRSGRNAARLRDIIEQDYEQNTIDYRFNRTFVGNITGLKDEKLTSFMFRYRPGYYTTKNASEYDFVAMIRSNLKRYLRNQRTYMLPPLITPPVTN